MEKKTTDNTKKKKENDNKNKQKSFSERKRFVFRKKVCRFCKNPDMEIDYKNTDLLARFTKDRGKILPRRFTGNCARHQRAIARAVKRARAIALLPYVSE